MKKIVKKKVLVALSGGVDSAVATKLLIDQGYDVSTMFLSFWKPKGEKGFENRCCSSIASRDAKTVAETLGAPFHTYNFSELFKRKVVDYFLDSHIKGKTPNPCAVCNREVKIGALLETAMAWGFDYLATGHYVTFKNGKLYKGIDDNKDQSYFLHYLSAKKLSKILFPLGEYNKTQVRALAKKFKLPVATKSESQEVCFIPKTKNDFLEKNLDKLSPGNIKDTKGNVLGKHSGIELFTLGQRKGINIGGTGPYYVAKKKMKQKDIVVTTDFNDPMMLTKEIMVKNFNWVNTPKTDEIKAAVAIRYHQKPEKCIIKIVNKKRCQIVFNKAIRAVSPGQSAVVYKGRKMLGGGEIY